MKVDLLDPGFGAVATPLIAASFIAGIAFSDDDLLEIKAPGIRLENSSGLSSTSLVSFPISASLEG